MGEIIVAGLVTVALSILALFDAFRFGDKESAWRKIEILLIVLLALAGSLFLNCSIYGEQALFAFLQ